MTKITSDSVRELRAGDLLRHSTVGVVVFSRTEGDQVHYTSNARDPSWTDIPTAVLSFIGRPDEAGWIEWSGGENPVPGCRVDVRLGNNSLHSNDASEDWNWSADDHLPVTAFRLAAPSAESAGGDCDHSYDLDNAGQPGRCHDCNAEITLPNSPPAGDVAGARERIGERAIRVRSYGNLEGDDAQAAFIADLRAIYYAHDRQGEEIDRLRDRSEGLDADLRMAVQVAWKRGAKEWARLNYPDLVEWLEGCDAADAARKEAEHG